MKLEENSKKKISLKMYDVKPVQAVWQENPKKNFPPADARPEKNNRRPFLEKEDLSFSSPQPAHPPLDFLYDWKPSEEKVSFWEKKEIFWKYLKKASKISAVSFLTAGLILVFSSALKIKKDGLTKSRQALAQLSLAEKNLQKLDFQGSYSQFQGANEKLKEVAGYLDGLTGTLVRITRFFPYISKISSGSYLISCGEKISEAGILSSEIFQYAEEIKNYSQEDSISYLKIFQDNESRLERTSILLKGAQDDLNQVNLDDVPEENKDKILKLKEKIPEINFALAGFLSQKELIKEILGANGPRKYLFLFQNNQEMRATGGFIGSYAVLDIFNGRIRNFFVDGIFNPDGQLKERIVPPLPIQKISANWSLHDSNWFPDFPKSAEKAAWFYEKTGGPTVDGVVTMTPTVMERLLKITGPIEMPEYGVVVDYENFVEKIQYEVEVGYDKELNQPKKILGDLAPLILDRVFNCPDFKNMAQAMEILHESLNEKHILVYSRNWQFQKMLSDNSWSGEILAASKDYVNVVNTNANGYKTDGVVEEEIFHQADIQPDGTIIDTLTITRKHNGGNTPFEWWNKVNSNYQRIYVPQGSKLLSASGQTREINLPLLDYQNLGYKTDPQVRAEEESAYFDESSGTKIYDDKDKTVFANWVYVSPQESVTLEYKYLLPFKVLPGIKENSIDVYSLLAQKQSGSLGSRFISEINYPKSYFYLWKYPENAQEMENPENLSQKKIREEFYLEKDKFIGMAFSQ